MITESIHIYGDQKNLQGIATIPDDYKCKNIAIILLNAGLVHKVGPFNLNIDMARKLSASGYFVFRFDLAGLGDSMKIQSNRTNNQNTMDDLAMTMSHLESQYMIHKFIVIGLCTGADHSHKISVLDNRVIGNVCLDGYGYRTPTFWLKRVTPVLLNPARLLRSIISRLHTSPNITNTSGADSYFWKLPAKKDYISDMKQTFHRNVKSLYLFTGGVTVYYNYKDQFKDGFQRYDFWNNIEVDRYPEFDHTFLLIDDRQVMIKRVRDWLDKHFKD